MKGIQIQQMSGSQEVQLIFVQTKIEENGFGTGGWTRCASYGPDLIWNITANSLSKKIGFKLLLIHDEY